MSPLRVRPDRALRRSVDCAPMAPPTPAQLRARGRIEFVLRLVEPGLDLLLAVGDRVSRVVDRNDDDPIPAIRFPREVRPLPPGPPVETGS